MKLTSYRRCIVEMYLTSSSSTIDEFCLKHKPSKIHPEDLRRWITLSEQAQVQSVPEDTRQKAQKIGSLRAVIRNKDKEILRAQARCSILGKRMYPVLCENERQSQQLRMLKEENRILAESLDAIREDPRMFATPVVELSEHAQASIPSTAGKQLAEQELSSIIDLLHTAVAKLSEARGLAL